jgi:hypothetical protein
MSNPSSPGAPKAPTVHGAPRTTPEPKAITPAQGPKAPAPKPPSPSGKKAPGSGGRIYQTSTMIKVSRLWNHPGCDNPNAVPQDQDSNPNALPVEDDDRLPYFR